MPVHRPKSKQPEIGSLRVAKKYSPGQDGAKLLTRRHGDSLVCVRHRLSDDKTMRYTTVELLVECTPVASRANAVVAVRLAADDRQMRTTLIACGATWDKRAKHWRVPFPVAKSLGLLAQATPIRE